jgi:indolepyruvate ferredoxin oxidoreductase
VRQAEARLGRKHLALADSVARYLFKLMAYKDEYEVARLHTDVAFQTKVAALFEGDFQLHFHLAPPLLARKNEKGELQKQRYGPATLWVFRLLTRFKGLRGTAMDLFGKTPERLEERALIPAYRAVVDELLTALASSFNDERYQLALEIARIPEQIRGFGHVKARHLKAARQNWESLLLQFRLPSEAKKVA